MTDEEAARLEELERIIVTHAEAARAAREERRAILARIRMRKGGKG